MGAFKVIIIGSGLAGSLLANGLIRESVQVVVYERLRPETKREGYQIRLGADALKGFRACLSPEHIQEIVAKCGRANGTRSGAPVVYSKDFDVLLDASKFPTYNKSAPINRVLLRDLLAQPVSDAGCLVAGKQFERYSVIQNPGAGETIRVHFEDGSYDECDLLIGADGSHSKVRCAKVHTLKCK
jgi:2-polyprenyl-6-methoxyphenol hydroxylase-like FAD-dependent oxidoreductase